MITNQLHDQVCDLLNENVLQDIEIRFGYVRQFDQILY